MIRWWWLWRGPRTWKDFAAYVGLYVVALAVGLLLAGHTWKYSVAVSLVGGGLGAFVAAFVFRRKLGSQVVELERL